MNDYDGVRFQRTARGSAERQMVFCSGGADFGCWGMFTPEGEPCYMIGSHDIEKDLDGLMGLVAGSRNG